MKIRQIKCPSCNFTRQVDASTIPPNAATATCPKCKKRFVINGFEDTGIQNDAIGSQLDHSAQLKEQHLTSSNKSTILLLVVGFVFSFIWLIVLNGIRYWGDGSTISSVNIAMFLPLLACIATMGYMMFKPSSSGSIQPNGHHQIFSQLYQDVTPGVDYECTVSKTIVPITGILCIIAVLFFQVALQLGTKRFVVTSIDVLVLLGGFLFKGAMRFAVVGVSLLLLLLNLWHFL